MDDDIFNPKTTRVESISFSRLVWGVAFGVMLANLICIIIGIAVGFGYGALTANQRKAELQSQIEMYRQQIEETTGRPFSFEFEKPTTE